HMIVGAGSGPAVVLAVGTRGGRKGLVYAVDPLAIAHRAGLEQEATKPEEAYAGFPAWGRCRYREGSLPDLKGLRVAGRLAEIADSFFTPAVNDLVPYEPGKPVEE